MRAPCACTPPHGMVPDSGAPAPPEINENTTKIDDLHLKFIENALKIKENQLISLEMH